MSRSASRRHRTTPRRTTPRRTTPLRTALATIVAVGLCGAGALATAPITAATHNGPNPPTGPGAAVDPATLALRAGVDPCAGAAPWGFTDVPDTNVHGANIDCTAGLGIAKGGAGGAPLNEYGPHFRTSRAQMAGFLARVAALAGVKLPAHPPDAFGDDETSGHELAINQLAALGVIGGNGEAGRAFDGERTISRGEMASFLQHLIAVVEGEPLSAGADAFADDRSSLYEADINALAAAGIVRGRDGHRYDPAGPVQRDAMASFLVRTIQHLTRAGGLK